MLMSFLNPIHGTNCAVEIFKTITYNIIYVFSNIFFIDKNMNISEHTATFIQEMRRRNYSENSIKNH